MVSNICLNIGKQIMVIDSTYKVAITTIERVKYSPYISLPCSRF